MALRGLGQFAGGATTGYLKAREDLRQQDEEDRKAQEAADKAAYKAALSQEQPAQAEMRQGLGFTKGEQTAYIPNSGTAEEQRSRYQAMMDQGYQLPSDTASVPYREVNSGGRTLGQYTGESQVADAGKAVGDYNDGQWERKMGLAAQYGQTGDISAFSAAGLYGGQKKMQGLQSDSLKLQTEALGLTVDEKKKANALGAEHAKNMSDPFAALKRMYNNNELGAGTGEHAGQVAQYEELPDGSASIRYYNRDTGELAGRPQVLTREQAMGAVNDAYFAKLAAISPDFAIQNASRMDKNAVATRMERLEVRKVEAQERYQNATTENQKQHYANELLKINNESKKWQALYGQKQPQQDLFAYQLKQLKDFDEAKANILDDTTLTTAQQDQKIAQLQRKFGGPLGAKPEPEDPILASLQARLRTPGADIGETTTAIEAHLRKKAALNPANPLVPQRDPKATPGAPGAAGGLGGRQLPPVGSRTLAEDRAAEAAAAEQDRGNLRGLNREVATQFDRDVGSLSNSELYAKYKNKVDALTSAQGFRIYQLHSDLVSRGVDPAKIQPAGVGLGR